jgi:ribosomal protein S27AE
MAGRIAELQKTARRFGIFVDDHELLTCSKCGLMEDVLFDGRLVTCREDGGDDTGLRFSEHPRAGGRFICPECGTVTKAS